MSLLEQQHSTQGLFSAQTQYAESWLLKNWVVEI